MKSLQHLLRRVPKKAAAIVAIAIATITIPAALYAWGPSRTTYTIDNPADHVTFNSITDNPNVGDERNFLHIKEAGAPNSAYASTVTLQAGKTYDVYLYYHNNAATSLNASGKGVAQNAYVKTQIPAVVDGSATLNGFVGASNATPKEVWDNVTLKSNGAVAVSYVNNSAVIHSNGAVNGKTLSNTIATSGAPIGYDSLNGVLPGCFQYSGYVSFQITVNQPNFTMSKLVSKHGANKWVDSYTAQPGETVDYLINYRNTGTTQQDNVTMSDKLPAGMSYVNGSTVLGNSKAPAGAKEIDGVTTTGVNIGSYAPNGNAWMIFSAKVADNDRLPACGANTLRNTAQVSTPNGAKNDTADVIVNKTCTPETPVYSCDGLTVSKISRTEFRFATNYTAKNGATFKSITYVIYNAQGTEIARTTNPGYTQNTPGNYSVQAIVTVTVKGTDKTTTGESCRQSFVVESPSTPVTPTTPTELPKTGASDPLMVVAGLSSLVLAASYYVASRRGVLRAFNR